MSPKRAVRILLADDHAIVRSGIRMLLHAQEHLQVVGEAANGQEAVEKARELQPDLVITDVSMPELDGFQVTAAVKKELPKTKVLLLSTHGGEEYLYRGVQLGGSGYVVKSATDAELLEAVEQVMMDQIYLRPPEAKVLAADYLRRVRESLQDQSHEALTPREQEVLVLVAEGLTNQEIAARLIISVRTVETHRSRVMDKLGLHKRSELVDYARRAGLIVHD